MPQPDYEFHDAHFHLTNYIQEGTDIRRYLEIMGDRVGRSTVFGLPLQQMWSYQNTGNFAPVYYLQSDAPMYYYSFTDAYIASVYNKLTTAEKQRLDPLISGFNPADMYATDHVKRVLLAFPGVFSGIGEFSVHKEFVSSKVAGEIASLTNPALDRLFDFAAEVGLIVLIHNDIDMPFAKPGTEPVYLAQMKALLKRHPDTKIIWAHMGLGRIVHPVQHNASEPLGGRNTNFMQIAENILEDPDYSHVYFDISWDEVAKYLSFTPQSLENATKVISRFPERFLFGTDVVAPTGPEMYFAVFDKYEVLLKSLDPDTREKLLKGNYENIFDEARKKVRAWEKANVH
jgi:hypothetical protein